MILAMRSNSAVERASRVEAANDQDIIGAPFLEPSL